MRRPPLLFVAAFQTAPIVAHQAEGSYQPTGLVVEDLLNGFTGPLPGDLRPVVRLYGWPGGGGGAAQASLSRMYSSNADAVYKADDGWVVSERKNGQVIVSPSRPDRTDGARP